MEPNTHTLANTKIVNSCHTLRILIFWEIMRTNNFFLLDLNYSEDKKYTEAEQTKIKDSWFKIYDEVFKLRNSGVSRSILQEKSKQLIFEEKLRLILSTNEHLNRLIAFKDDLSDFTFKAMLKDIYECYGKIDNKLRLDTSRSIDDNINIINKVFRALNNTYNFSIKKASKKVSAEIKNAHTIVVQVEQVIGRSLPDIETMSVARWIACEEMAQKINKAKQTKKNGRK